MFDSLITVEDLGRQLDSVRIYDLRWSLTDPTKGIADYRAGHIPGAHFVDLDKDLSTKEGDGRHPLPTLNAFAVTLGRLGISPSTRVVVYDDAGGAIAARMWWMLRSIGHEMVALLDGGLASWIEAGLPLATGEVTSEDAVYEPAHDFTGVVRYHDLVDRTVVDVRAPERYDGREEPVDPKAGHIPGAINLPLTGNLDRSGRFLGRTALAERFGNLVQPVVSCGSGVNACHTALAMVVAGLEMPDVYIGSFSDWSTRDLPVRIGDRP